MKTRAFLTGLLLFVLLVLAFAIPLAAQVNVTNFDNVRSDGFIRADGYLRSGSYAQVGTFLITDMPASNVTVTSGGTITPTGSNLNLTSAGAVGTRLIVTSTVPDGTWLFIQNVGSNTITLTDTAPLVLGGNAALGANDTLVLRLRNGSWVQFSKTDN